MLYTLTIIFSTAPQVDTLLSPLYRPGNGGLQSINALSKDTSLVMTRERIYPYFGLALK